MLLGSGVACLPEPSLFFRQVKQSKKMPTRGKKFKPKLQSQPPFRCLCYESRKLGLGEGRVQRVKVARVKAREKAWKATCFRQSLHLSRQGASEKVLRLWRTQPRSRPQGRSRVVAPAAAAVQAPSSSVQSRPQQCPQPTVHRSVKRRRPPRLALVLRCLVAIDLVLRCRDHLVLNLAFVVQQRRKISEVAAQSCDCQLGPQPHNCQQGQNGDVCLLVGVQSRRSF